MEPCGTPDLTRAGEEECNSLGMISEVTLEPLKQGASYTHGRQRMKQFEMWDFVECFQHV